MVAAPAGRAIRPWLPVIELVPTITICPWLATNAFPLGEEPAKINVAPAPVAARRNCALVPKLSVPAYVAIPLAPTESIMLSADEELDVTPLLIDTPLSSWSDPPLIVIGPLLIALARRMRRLPALMAVLPV